MASNITRVAELINGYRIRLQDRLGGGGFGNVYIGERSPSDRVAVKVMIPPPQHMDSYMKYYRRELDSLKSTHHPNVVGLLHHENIAQCAYLLLELCDADLLHFAQSHEFPENKKYQFIENMLCAVNYLHDVKIIHRDIKPENMLIKAQGEGHILKLSDLGLSLRVPEDSSSYMSATAGVGTSGWKAPEVIPDPRRPTRTLNYGKPSDAFAVGLNIQSIATHTPGSWLQAMKGPDGQSYGEHVKWCLSDGNPVSLELHMDGDCRQLAELTSGLLAADPKHRWRIGKAYAYLLLVKDNRQDPDSAQASDAQPTVQEQPGPVAVPAEPTSSVPSEHQEPASLPAEPTETLAELTVEDHIQESPAMAKAATPEAGSTQKPSSAEDATPIDRSQQQLMAALEKAVAAATKPTMADVTEYHRPKEAFPEYQEHMQAKENVDDQTTEKNSAVDKQSAKEEDTNITGDTEVEAKPVFELKYKYKADQWSPLNPEGKKVYDRDFATKKPAGLTHVRDIILDEVSMKSSISSPEKIHRQLNRLIIEEGAEDTDVMDWISTNIGESHVKEAQNVRAIVTSVCMSSIVRGNKVNFGKLSKWMYMMQHFIDHDDKLELQALFAVQALVHKLGHPADVLHALFDMLYDEDVISEEVFSAWYASEEEMAGKEKTRNSVKEFIVWLRNNESIHTE